MKYVIAICLTFAAISSSQAAEMSHEETVVRTAYAKFAYASEQYEMTQLATESMGNAVGLPENKTGMTNDQRLASAQVGFALSDFVVGNIQDILDRKIADFVSPASSEVLMAGRRDYQFAEGGKMFNAPGIEPRWQLLPAQEAPETEAKLADMYQMQWHQPRPASAWQRYASYSITVTFQGKSHGPYKALFIFGHDPKGNEVIEPVDATTDASGLVLAIQGHLFPSALASTRLRNSPVVAKWLATKQSTSPSCSVGQGDVCCDLARLQCGPGRADLTQAVAEPILGHPDCLERRNWHNCRTVPRSRC